LCLALFIGSKKRLPLTAWDEKNPHVFLTGLEEKDRSAGGHFTLPHTYYAGSHLYCGCGFSKEGETGEELRRVERSFSELADILRRALHRGGEVEIYPVWEGEQEKPVEGRQKITLADLTRKDFKFRERWLYAIGG